MLYTFQHGGTLRSFGFAIPPDWFDQVDVFGPLPLLVLLHGGADDRLDLADEDISDVRDFMLLTKIERLLTYDSAAIPPTLVPPIVLQPADTKPKLVALFPVGLGQEGELSGGWKCGHMRKEAALFDVDDVSFVIACIDRLQSLLVNQYFQILGHFPGPIFDVTRRYAAGFGQGGQLCYRLAAERPGFFKAIAPHSCTPSGWQYRFQDTAGLPAEQLARPADDNDTTSVLHIHGTADGVVQWDGGDSSTNDETGAFVLTDIYDRIDDRLDEVSGVAALWASGLDWTESMGDPTVTGVTLRKASTEWVNSTTGAIVRLLIVNSLGHEWASFDPATSTGFDAIGVIWDFFLLLEPPP